MVRVRKINENKLCTRICSLLSVVSHIYIERNTRSLCDVCVFYLFYGPDRLMAKIIFFIYFDIVIFPRSHIITNNFIFVGASLYLLILIT